MKVKIDFGATSPIPEHTFQEIIHTALDAIKQHGRKCCKATLYLTEYDEDGRCSETRFSIKEVDDAGNLIPLPFQDEYTEGLLLRNKRYARNETTQLRQYIGKFDNDPKSHLYRVFEKV